MPLAISFALNSEINISLMVGTVWAGGDVADLIFPLSAQMVDTSFGEHFLLMKL
ncbi:Na+/H+ antiporter NhaC family protein [Sporosalibacterium faouarense]|uniref:Na+/H+ antiporter NhaC family protein n=1 Tax=Sporosalibacterium faouarense TaxID=516123 RepID=UPI00192C5D12|nr:Na+/H+ antiporter NhaC family protein [Sporosalibacterium faouarense]